MITYKKNMKNTNNFKNAKMKLTSTTTVHEVILFEMIFLSAPN